MTAERTRSAEATLFCSTGRKTNVTSDKQRTPATRRVARIGSHETVACYGSRKESFSRDVMSTNAPCPIRRGEDFVRIRGVHVDRNVFAHYNDRHDENVRQMISRLHRYSREYLK